VQKIHKGFKFIKYLMPSILWGAIIFFIISIPKSTIPDSRLLAIKNIDKVIHITMFFIFSFLLCFGFLKQKVLQHPRNYFLTYAIIFGIFYGALTEIMQAVWFVSRSGNVLDFFANSLGAIIGALVFRAFFNLQLFKNSKILN